MGLPNQIQEYDVLDYVRENLSGKYDPVPEVSTLGAPGAIGRQMGRGTRSARQLDYRIRAGQTLHGGNQARAGPGRSRVLCRRPCRGTPRLTTRIRARAQRTQCSRVKQLSKSRCRLTASAYLDPSPTRRRSAPMGARPSTPQYRRLERTARPGEPLDVGKPAPYGLLRDNPGSYSRPASRRATRSG